MTRAPRASKNVPPTRGRTVLIGDRGTLGWLCRVAEEGGVRVAGYLLLGEGGGEPAGAGEALEGVGARRLGGEANLEPLVTARIMEAAMVSLPLDGADRLKRIAGRLDRLGVTWCFVPTLEDTLAGRAKPMSEPSRDTRAATAPTLPAVAAVPARLDPASLIDRTPRPLDDAAIRGVVADRTVLITGAGGSIGSELARTVAAFGPGRLVLVERSENPLFEIDRGIARLHPALPRVAELHDVTSAQGTIDLFDRHRPHVVIHAAAHKHVPMMETHPTAAVENNFYGTRAVVDASIRCGVRRCVMISTDKAVNPSSVMGATKRLAELYVQAAGDAGLSLSWPLHGGMGVPAGSGGATATLFSIVRFGNVLGSACSVLPIWADQLARGLPLTVTHEAMTRYFMTIPEAAGLVLQAAALARESGGVFLLDMGEPIRILDLARRFLLAHGLEPDRDVPIRITGVRPGEKLHEELAYAAESMLPTPHPSIRLWQTTPPTRGHLAQITTTFDRLRHRGGDPAHPWRGVPPRAVAAAVRAAVPEMVAAAA